MIAENMRDVLLPYYKRTVSRFSGANVSRDNLTVRFLPVDNGSLDTSTPGSQAGTRAVYRVSEAGETYISRVEVSYERGLHKDLGSFRSLIAHELVHVMQNVVDRPTAMAEMMDRYRYENNPHEIEAYNLQNRGANHYTLVEATQSVVQKREGLEQELRSVQLRSAAADNAIGRRLQRDDREEAFRLSVLYSELQERLEGIKNILDNYPEDTDNGEETDATDTRTDS